MTAGRSRKSCDSLCGSPSFTLVELLITIAVIAIIAALAYPSISGVAQQATTVVARQQQVELQQALDAWVVAESSGTSSLGDARAKYSAATTDAAKLALVEGYLKNAFFNSGGTGVTTGELNSAGLELRFSEWTETGYPSVGMHKK